MFIKQDNLPEVLKYIEARLRRTSAASRAFLDSSSGDSRSRHRSSSFETHSETSQPYEKFLPGECEEVAIGDSLEFAQEQSGPASDPNSLIFGRPELPQPATRRLSYSQLPNPHGTLESVNLETLGAYKSAKISEVAETPVHPPSAKSNISFDNPHLPSTLISQPFPSRASVEGDFPSQPKPVPYLSLYRSRIPKTKILKHDP